MFTGQVIFFRQKAALNFPSQFPLQVKYTADNQEEIRQKQTEVYYPDPKALRQNIL